MLQYTLALLIFRHWVLIIKIELLNILLKINDNFFVGSLNDHLYNEQIKPIASSNKEYEHADAVLDSSILLSLIHI